MKKTVMIVEDDPWLAQLQSDALQKAGYKTKLVPNAPSAIAAIDEGLPDVILLDVLMTGQTGFALLNELQSYTDTVNLPIILCTNLASDIQLADVKPYGVQRIIDKSTMQPSDIIAAIRGVLI